MNIWCSPAVNVPLVEYTEEVYIPEDPEAEVIRRIVAKAQANRATRRQMGITLPITQRV